MNAIVRSAFFVVVGLAIIASPLLFVGCAGRPELLPNGDHALRKTSAEFAADAAKRFPYKSDAPRKGVAVARAQVGYSLNTLEVVNLDDTDWSDVELWVNQKYVVYIPRMPHNELKRLPFQMIYNEKGQSFPTDNGKPETRVNKLEVFHDGAFQDVTVQLAD
jgi:hypothetical protein